MNNYDGLMHDLDEREFARAEVAYLSAGKPGDPDGKAPGTLTLRKRTYGGFLCRLERDGWVRHYDVPASDVLEYERLGWDVRDPHGYLTPLPITETGVPPEPEMEGEYER